MTEGALTTKQIVELIEKAKETGVPIQIYTVINVQPRHEVYIRYIDKFCYTEGGRLHYATQRDREADKLGANGRTISLDKSDVWLFKNYFLAFAKAYKISGKIPVFTNDG